MDFIKKHYEKILLSVVLLGLVGALAFLPLLILENRVSSAVSFGRTPRPLPPLEMSGQDQVLERLSSPYQLDFSTTNKLFNPVEWKRDYSGNLIKIVTGREVGPHAAVVTKITPLYLLVTLDEVETNELGALYIIGVEHQGSPYPQLRYKRQHYATKGEKNNDFTLIDIKGPPNNPDALILKLADTGELASVSQSKPFRRVEGYEADLKYPPENKSFQDERVGSMISFGGENYLIVAIDQNEVILSAQSNQKKTTLRYTP